MSHSHTFRRQSTTLPIEYHDRCRDTQRAHSNAHLATDAPRCEREGTPGPTLVRFTGLEHARSLLPRTLALVARLAGLHRMPGYSGEPDPPADRAKWHQGGGGPSVAIGRTHKFNVPAACAHSDFGEIRLPAGRIKNVVPDETKQWQVTDCSAISVAAHGAKTRVCR